MDIQQQQFNNISGRKKAYGLMGGFKFQCLIVQSINWSETASWSVSDMYPHKFLIQPFHPTKPLWDETAVLSSYVDTWGFKTFLMRNENNKIM